MPKKTSKSALCGVSVKDRKANDLDLDAILIPPKFLSGICIGINRDCECVNCLELLCLKKGGKVKWADIKRFNDPIKGGFKFIDTELPKWIGAGRVAQQNSEKREADRFKAEQEEYAIKLDIAKKKSERAKAKMKTPIEGGDWGKDMANALRRCYTEDGVSPQEKATFLLTMIANRYGCADATMVAKAMKDLTAGKTTETKIRYEDKNLDTNLLRVKREGNRFWVQHLTDTHPSTWKDSDINLMI